MGDQIKINKLFDFSVAPKEGEHCIYCLFDPEGVCIYVGQTQNLEGRIYAHFREGKDFVKFSFDTCEKIDASESEARMIVKMKPTLNKTLPGNSTFITTTTLKRDITQFITDNEDRLPIVFSGAKFNKTITKKYVRVFCYNEVITCIERLLVDPKESFID